MKTYDELTQDEKVKLLASFEKQQAFRKAYNQRPEVKAKRREYNKNRWQLLKAIKEEFESTN